MVAAMALTQADCVTAITEHSAGLAATAQGRLDADVEHCPGWTVADLVAHVVDVHWFWATIVDQRLQQPPVAEQRPQRPDDDDLVATFQAGAARLVRVLAEADPQDHVWTWAPAQQDAAFVIRHQVQEIAVHHWDAVNATGGTLALEPEVAADAVDEFLHFSVSSDDDPGDPRPDPMGGSFVLHTTDTDDQWLVSDGAAPGTVRVSAWSTADGAAEESGGGSAYQTPVITASASDLLLWLYQRVEVDTGGVDAELLDRFRVLTFTT